jgi:hypothetical protein
VPAGSPLSQVMGTCYHLCCPGHLWCAIMASAPGYCSEDFDVPRSIVMVVLRHISQSWWSRFIAVAVLCRISLLRCGVLCRVLLPGGVLCSISFLPGGVLCRALLRRGGSPAPRRATLRSVAVGVLCRAFCSITVGVLGHSLFRCRGPTTRFALSQWRSYDSPHPIVVEVLRRAYSSVTCLMPPS